MPWDRDGNYIEGRDPEDDLTLEERAARGLPLSPYEQAVLRGGQPAGDELMRASNEYYSNYPSGHEDGREVNWYQPESYNWLTNTPGQPEPESPPAPPQPPPSGSGGGGSWFDDMPSMPAWSETWTPPTWDKTFQPMTMGELEGDQGYQNRYAAMHQGQERAAAAKGSILSGGYIGKALPRALGEFASQEFNVANERKRGDYNQEYAQFQDNTQQQYNAYLQRYRQYQDQVSNNLDFAGLGLNATLGGRP